MEFVFFGWWSVLFFLWGLDWGVSLYISKFPADRSKVNLRGSGRTRTDSEGKKL